MKGSAWDRWSWRQGAGDKRTMHQEYVETTWPEAMTALAVVGILAFLLRCERMSTPVLMPSTDRRWTTGTVKDGVVRGERTTGIFPLLCRPFGRHRRRHRIVRP